MWVLVSTIQKWWFLFEKQRTFRSTKKDQRSKLQALLDKNSVRMLEKLAEALNVDKSTVSDRLHAIAFTRNNSKKANGFHMNCLNWLFKIV